MTRVAATVFFALQIAWAVAGAYLWQLRCEGFGCEGIGVAWFAWVAVLFGPALVLGVILNSAGSLTRTWAGAVQIGVRIQVAVGMALLLYWGVSVVQ